MNRFLRGTCVLAFALVALGSAKAQDFKGFYVGANAGEAFGRASMQTSPIFSPTGYFATTSTPAITAASTQQATPNGLTAGGGAGYSYQWDNFVVGFEADFGKMDLSGATTVTQVYPCCAPTAFTVLQTAETSWLFTARPRMGVAFGHFLAYGTGGGGVEFKVGGGGHWSVKAEYLFADFGTGVKTTSTNLTAFTPPIPFPTNVFTHQADLTTHLFRSGLNFRF